MKSELQSFVLKAEARKLFRHFLRVTRSAPASRDELRDQIRHEFLQPVEESDLYARKYRLSDGRTRLKMLSEMLGMQL
ncbi:hypothetical protein ACKKBG_A05505 [Auxenochlorella protothecoides x Auxenochlorella symbiontica]